MRRLEEDIFLELLITLIEKLKLKIIQ